MCTGRAKPIRIIGNPDNQRPDKWSSTLLSSDLKRVCMLSPYKGKPGGFRRRSSPSTTHALPSFGSCGGDLAF
jgi:hypothetical protein